MDYKPVVLKDEAEAKALSSAANTVIRDLLPSQVKELFIIRHLAEITDKAAIASMPAFDVMAKRCTANAQYVHYPWLNLVIRTVGPDNYFALKTNRNQDLVTADEQARLKDYTTAVLGLSVGSNIAFLLTQAGLSNRIFLADPDTLDTSNLNRIFTGVQDLGLNKSILAARKIAEGNPYADAVPMPDGISPESLATLLREQKIDCLIEEVDSLHIKIAVRRLALQHKVPVVMITDNGFSIILHVERYDLGYDKIFEKEPSYWDAKLKEATDIQRVSQIIVEDIIGGMDKIDPRLIASTLRIFQRQLVAWPQLGSTAMLGGVAVTQVLKKIALGESKEPFVKRFIQLGT